VYGFQVFLAASDTGLDFDSKAQIEQIRAVRTSRFIKRFGQIPELLMQEIDQRIREHLNI
jgi:mRNA interferase MazF